MTLFERTKEISKKRGMSLQDVAKKAGLGVNAIYKWQKSTPTVEKIEAVAKTLDVSVDYLLGKTDNPSTSGDKNVDLSDPNANDFLSFDGKPISDDDLEIIKRLLRGK